MSDLENKASVTSAPATDAGNSGRNPHHRRGRYNRRPGNRRPGGQGEETAVVMSAQDSQPVGEGVPDAEVSAAEGENTQETVGGERRPRRRNRTRRSGRSRTGDQTAHNETDPVRSDAELGDDDGDNAPAGEAYTETEADIIGREIHEIVTEERIEAALADEDEDLMTAESENAAVSGMQSGGETEKVPVEVVGVRFKAAGKVYYFDPDGSSFRDGDTVIVETARGIEFGFVVGGNRTVMAADLVSPLKKVLREATEEDCQHYEENNQRRMEAFRICREKIAEHNIEMKLVDVEYTFDNNKLLFYFTADGRVDFRELVKDLAAVFRTRIELRQIGIRDEAKLMGGLGVCGRPFCCHSFLSDFVQVSIKMAKEQNLSLNSAKISGTCGRLMCCLRYEYDVYEEELKKTPKLDAVVETPDGEGVVCEVIPLAGLIRVKFTGNRSDATPKLYHRDNVKVIGKMNWKSGNITYHDAENKA